MTKNVGARGARITTHIGRRVTQSIFDAFDFAADRGLHLNSYVVIQLRERDAASAATIFTGIRHRYRDFLSYRRRSGLFVPPPAYVYTMENPHGTVHVNWALHVPAPVAGQFRPKLEGWIKKEQGELDEFVLDLQPIDPNYAKRLAKYVVKGTEPAFIRHFYLDDVAKPQGPIAGRRACVSPSIGRRAREQAGYRRARGRHRKYPRPSYHAPAAAPFAQVHSP